MGVTDQDSCTVTKTKTLKCVLGPIQDQRVETSHPWRVVFYTLGAKDGLGNGFDIYSGIARIPYNSMAGLFNTYCLNLPAYTYRTKLNISGRQIL